MKIVCDAEYRILDVVAKYPGATHDAFVLQYSPVVRWQRPIFYRNLAISGYNRFFAFFTTLDHVVQESVGCNDYPRLAFSKFKMAAKMAAKSRFKL